MTGAGNPVVTRLMGGLGNQLFQYAAGLALARRLEVPLLLDRTFLDSRPAHMDWTPRELALDAFRVPLRFATDAIVRDLRRPIDRRFHRLLQRVLPGLYSEVHLERGPGFDPAFFRHTAPVYLEGFWQNERYFTDLAHELRHELFVPFAAPRGMDQVLLGAIQSCVSASVHVRRGDYVSHAAAKEYHGNCSVDHYVSAARELAEQHGVEHFFVFSDEPEWAAEHLPLPRPFTIVSHNTGRNAHWDLFLMKHCRHHIIANSSFSWWGAWLNERPDKVVIAPATWFAGSGTPSSAIIPPSWTVR
ncbi:MAG: alpha-1,2-fucosyltransferase [Flavobacteriales bacterium]|nr:alpha-1,2-fucosyltransferase [Flavobacteriales bacterium]MCB0786111.1 alpha-1,2-fucosyltransferase [Flavobacteriales bacterium]MCB0808359.1 alpha-1,2-fucosyltransferase [Flavobacteriales bacterium]MCB0815287.1 alpha-1,2-fucosyltransferase [Flavobacteriales bacterium]